MEKNDRFYRIGVKLFMFLIKVDIILNFLGISQIPPPCAPVDNSDSRFPVKMRTKTDCFDLYICCCGANCDSDVFRYKLKLK